MSTIGERIRNRRKELDMSVDTLAERLGKNRATVYRYENDDIENMPVSVIGPLSEILKVSPAYIMGWCDEMHPEVDVREAAQWGSESFRQHTIEILSTADPADLEAAGIDKARLERTMGEKRPITLDEACDIADQLGESIDFLVGRQLDDIHTLYLELSDANQGELLNYARYLLQKDG